MSSPRSRASAPISEVEMELAEPGTIMVYNCLFEDQANIAPLPCAAPAADTDT